MKTRILSLIALLIFTAGISRAADVVPDIREQIMKQVKYPTSLSEKLVQGTVYVEFLVKDDGSLEVINCFSKIGELQNYIFKTLSDIRVEASVNEVGKNMVMRFDFKLV